MDNLEIIQFHPNHIEIANLTTHEADNFKRIPSAYQTMVDLNKKSAQAVTILIEDKVLLMCGFIILWPGVVEVWLIPTVYLEMMPITTAKAIKQFVESTLQIMKCHRMQAQVIDEEQHNRFMVFLDFQCEGVMKQYSDKKEDFKIWSRVS